MGKLCVVNGSYYVIETQLKNMKQISIRKYTKQKSKVQSSQLVRK